MNQESALHRSSRKLCERVRLTEIKRSRVRFDLGIAHPAAHVRVDAQDERLQEETAIELDGIDVDSLRLVVLDVYIRLDVPCARRMECSD